MSLGRLLAVGECVDGKPAGGSPFPSGELEFLLDLGSEPTQKSGEALSKLVAGVLDNRRASQTEDKGGKFCFPEAYRRKTASSCSSRRKQISIQGGPIQRKGFWESPWDVRVSASECLELEPRIFREKRKLSLRQWLRKGFSILRGKKERKIDGFYEKQ